MGVQKDFKTDQGSTANYWEWVDQKLNKRTGVLTISYGLFQSQEEYEAGSSPYFTREKTYKPGTVASLESIIDEQFVLQIKTQDEDLKP